MSTFEQQRRQQFITEDYYHKVKDYTEEGIYLFSEEYEPEDTEFESGEADKWNSLAYCYERYMYLKYTAGQPIEEVAALFPIFLDYKDKQAIAEAEFKKTYRNNVLGNIESSLPVIALAYLLDCRDLLPLIKLLTDGERNNHPVRSMIDAMIARFFRVNDSTQVVTDYDQDYALYDPAYHWTWCKLLDESATRDVSKEAIEALDNYLKDWYSNQKFESWYNSHTQLEDSYAYVGYWAFEAAAMVYFLDLDDSSLHKYLYYPKDIVAWIRQRHPIDKDIKKEVYDNMVVQENETAQMSGYYQDPTSKRVIYLHIGDIAPSYPKQTEVNYARRYVWYKLTDYGVSLIPIEIINPLKK